MVWAERIKDQLVEIQCSSKKKRKRESASYTSITLESERLVGLKDHVLDLFQEVNLQALDEKGSVIDWNETKTDKHYHTIWEDKWSHSSNQIETRLLIPEVGEVIVFAPTHGKPEYGGISASHIHVISIGMRDRGGKGTLCNRVGKKVSLGHTDEYISERLKVLLTEEVVRIHNAALR